MSDVPIDLEPARIQSLLGTARFGRSLDVRTSTGSTNDDARRAAAEGAVDGHVVLADTQTHGRGSRGRAWISPPGSDLYFSVVAHVPLAPKDIPPLTLAAGLAVASTVDALTAAGRARLKWPNDVCVDDGKCAGILVEGTSTREQSGPVVIGIGLNVNRTEWPDGLDYPATSLCLITAKRFDRAAVLAQLLLELERWVDRFVAHGPAPVIAALEKRLHLHGERVRCDDVEGVLEGVSPTGTLRIRTDDGLRELASGTLRRASA